MKVHFFKCKSFIDGFPRTAACSFFLLLGEEKFITKNKKKVTCENCKRTKLFRKTK